MASTLALTLKTDRSSTDLGERLLGRTRQETLQALISYLKGVALGTEAASLRLQTGTAAPVAASGTWTLASVIATDVASVAGVSFTFTSTPSLETDVEVDVPSAKAFASATDISTTTGDITESSHGYETGDVGQLSTSNTLPTGFSASTDYYVIKVSANVYRLASSLANAQAGTQIIPSAVGTGNQTFTLTADKYNAAKLAAAVNAHSTVSKIVSASASAAIVTVTCRVPGVIGNFIQFTDSDSTITSSGSGYLAGGTGGATSDATTHAFGI
jgi:hypothetical protein